MTTVDKFKAALELLEESVTVTDKKGYQEAIESLKKTQMELSKALAREGAVHDRLKHELGMNDGEFFRYIMPVIVEADAEGSKNYYRGMRKEK